MKTIASITNFIKTIGFTKITFKAHQSSANGCHYYTPAAISPAPLKRSTSTLIQVERSASEWGHVKCVHPFTKGFRHALGGGSVQLKALSSWLSIPYYGRAVRVHPRFHEPVRSEHWEADSTESITTRGPWRPGLSIHQDGRRCVRYQSVYMLLRRQLMFCTLCQSV